MSRRKTSSASGGGGNAVNAMDEMVATIDAIERVEIIGPAESNDDVGTIADALKKAIDRLGGPNATAAKGKVDKAILLARQT